MNKENENAKLSVDLSWAVPTGTSTTTSTTTMIDQSTNPKRVYGLEDDDVTTEPNVVDEDLIDNDIGQTWTVIEVKTKETTETKKFYTFSINNYFLTGYTENNIKVEGN